MQTKSQIRKELLQKRKELSITSVNEYSANICKRIIHSTMYKTSDVLLVYSAIQHEVDLKVLILDALSKHKKIYFPRVEGEDMNFYAVKDKQDLKEGYFHILEPSADEEKRLDINGLNNPAIMILPGAAFSRTGYRIGYGKGFYDRFLQKYNKDKKFLTIGAAYQIQVVDSFEPDVFDYPISYIFTENEEVIIHDNSGIM